VQTASRDHVRPLGAPAPLPRSRRRKPVWEGAGLTATCLGVQLREAQCPRERSRSWWPMPGCANEGRLHRSTVFESSAATTGRGLHNLGLSARPLPMA